MERGVTVILVFFLAIFASLCWNTPAAAYKPDSFYNFTLQNGKSLHGKLIKVDSTTVTIIDSSQTKQTIKRSEIVEAAQAARTYNIEDLQKLPKLSYESKQSSDETEKKATRTYGGKTEEYWLSKTVQLALKSKRAEQSYEQLSRGCRQSKDPISCSKANTALKEIEKANKEYNQLLTDAREASAPVNWLETHYNWIRWGQEWKN